jgi:DNA-binding GntR family transcriptional regulator
MFVAVLSRTRHSMDDDAMNRSANHHFEITAAIAAHQPDWAESTMRSHILSARTSLFESMAKKAQEQSSLTETSAGDQE